MWRAQQHRLTEVEKMDLKTRRERKFLVEKARWEIPTGQESHRNYNENSNNNNIKPIFLGVIKIPKGRKDDIFLEISSRE